MSIGALVRRWAVLVLGVILVGVAVAIAVTQPVSFGWFAYAPLSNSSYVPTLSPVVAMPSGAAAMLIVGLVLIAAWVGFRLGRRSPRGR